MTTEDSAFSGLVYVTDAESSSLSGCKIDSTATKTEWKAPWIVVEPVVENLVLLNWPGRLLRVEVSEAAPVQPEWQTSYRWAFSVRILEERSPSELFGPHGLYVCEILNKVRQISLHEVQRLADNSNLEARRAYSRAFDAWIDSSTTKKGSPINQGFTLIHKILINRAREIEGDSAFRDDGNGEVSFAPNWAATEDAVCNAAMAYGAPDLLAPQEKDLLLSAWLSVFDSIEF